jgi:PPOX class probable F420-dependent enzyme
MATIPDSHRDLLDGEVKFSLNTTRQKVRNLQREPRCSLLLLDLANPYRYVEVRGDAVITPDDDYAFADRVGAKYGADLRDNDQPGEARVVVSVRPARVRTWG